MIPILCLAKTNWFGSAQLCLSRSGSIQVFDLESHLIQTYLNLSYPRWWTQVQVRVALTLR